MRNDQKDIDTAFILAAGRGERMRPLTDLTPKPLVQAGGKSLIQYHYEKLVNAGYQRIIVNHAHLGQQIESHLRALHNSRGDSVELIFSDEGDSALETAGGMIKALEQINRQYFLAINADIWTDFPYTEIKKIRLEHKLAHLVLVETPDYKAHHDFFLGKNGVTNDNEIIDANNNQGFTFSGISLLNTAIFEDCLPGKQSMTPLLRDAIDRRLISAEVYLGDWRDIGTKERLTLLREHLNKKLLS